MIRNDNKCIFALGKNRNHSQGFDRKLNMFIMKKLCVFLVGVALLTAFYACKKDSLGVYDPKMKIDKIYNEADGRYLMEQWFWDGELLTRIDYFRKSGNLDYSQHYFYDKNRLTRIEMEDQYSEFLYNGDMLTTINTYDGDRKVETYQLSYDKKKLSHISIENNMQAKRCAQWSPISLFMPVNDGMSTAPLFDRNSKREQYDFSNAEVDFIWDGDNIKYMKMSLQRPDSMQKLVFSYVYDESLNPMNRFFIMNVDHLMLNDKPSYLFCSKNNPASVYRTEEYGVYSKSKSYYYSYECYKNYPTKVYEPFLNSQNKWDTLLIYSYQYLY